MELRRALDRIALALPAPFLLDGLAVLFPCLMLVATTVSFGTNWQNHIWHIAYFAEDLRRHGAIPMTLSASGHIQMPVPVFYGYLFYPLMGALAALLGASLALRLAVIAALWAQHRLVKRALHQAGARLETASAAACLVTWAVYQLNAIYTWNLITEFFATTLLTCAVAYWFELFGCADADRRGQLRKSTALGLCWCLMIGTHPITGCYGTGALALIVAASCATTRGKGRRLLWLLPQFALAAFCLSAWVLATREFHAALTIIVETTREVHFMAADGVDTLLARLLPYAKPPAPITDPSFTPYVTATMNVPLLLLAAASGAAAVRMAPQARRAVLACAGACAALLGFLLWASLDPAVFHALPAPLRVIQFAARLVAYQNLVILGSVFIAALLLRAGGVELAAPKKAIVGCLLVSAIFVTIKLHHAFEIHKFGVPAPVGADLVRLPNGYIGAFDYATRSPFPVFPSNHGLEPAAALFSVGLGVHFGEILPLEFDLSHPALLLTNVLAFPWNHILLDGRPLSRWVSDRDTSYRVRYFLWVPVTAGHHVLETRFSPDPVWLFLRNWGFAVFGLWISAAAWLRFGFRFKRRRANS